MDRRPKPPRIYFFGWIGLFHRGCVRAEEPRRRHLLCRSQPQIGEDLQSAGVHTHLQGFCFRGRSGPGLSGELMPTLGLREESCALPDVTLVRVSGTFDVATLPQFEDLLKRLRQAGRVKIVVDLAGLDYISSSGLGAFIGTVDPFRAEGGDLVSVIFGDRYKKILKVVGLIAFWPVM